MYVYFNPQQMPGAGEGGGKSCLSLVEYLKKEQQIKVSENLVAYYKKEGDGFFNTTQENVAGDEVVKRIDKNAQGKGLKDREARFYNLYINPSQEELKHIGQDEAKMMDYTRDLMKEYVHNFGRIKKDGTPLAVEDIEWFAKVEHHRYFGEKDAQVRHNETYNAIRADMKDVKDEERLRALQEELDHLGGVYVLRNKKIELVSEVKNNDIFIKRKVPKPEDYQMHVHVIIGRNIKGEEKMSLSPMSNSKGGVNKIGAREARIGFNRSEFKEKSEMLFDLKFGHSRPYDQSYVHYNFSKNGSKLTIRPAKEVAEELEVAQARLAELIEKVRGHRARIQQVTKDRNETFDAVKDFFDKDTHTPEKFAKIKELKAHKERLTQLHEERSGLQAEIDELRLDIKHMYEEQREHRFFSRNEDFERVCSLETRSKEEIAQDLKQVRGLIPIVDEKIRDLDKQISLATTEDKKALLVEYREELVEELERLRHDANFMISKELRVRNTLFDEGKVEVRAWEEVLPELQKAQENFSVLKDKREEMGVTIEWLKSDRATLRGELQRLPENKEERVEKRKELASINKKLADLQQEGKGIQEQMDMLRLDMAYSRAEMRTDKHRRFKEMVDASKQRTPTFQEHLAQKFMAKIDPHRLGFSQNAVLLSADAKFPSLQVVFDNALRGRGINIDLKKDQSLWDIVGSRFEKKIDTLYTMEFLKTLDPTNIINILPQQLVAKSAQLVFKALTQGVAI